MARCASSARVATCLASDRGLEIVAVVHDAIMMHCPIERVDADCDTLVDYLVEASAILLDGCTLRVDSDSVIYHHHYGEKRCENMWNQVMQSLDKAEK